MPFHPPKSNRRAWLRYATAHAEETLVYTCRSPTPIERLAAAGYTRRVSAGQIWFEHADGRQTPHRASLGDAIKAGLEQINAD